MELHIITAIQCSVVFNSFVRSIDFVFQLIEYLHLNLLDKEVLNSHSGVTVRHLQLFSVEIPHADN